MKDNGSVEVRCTTCGRNFLTPNKTFLYCNICWSAICKGEMG